MELAEQCFAGVDTHKNQHTTMIIGSFHQCLNSVSTPDNPAHCKNFMYSLVTKIPDNKTAVFVL